MSETIGTALEPLFRFLVGDDVPIDVRFWDGSRLGRPGGVASLEITSPEALRWILYSPNDLGFGRAYVTGGLRVEGDLYGAMRATMKRVPADWKIPPPLLARALMGAARHGVIGMPPAPPQEETRLRGRPHSRRRDAAAISHHYDVSNEFYRLVLGPTMTYSCARFSPPEAGLDEAQEAKYELICRKLGLGEGQRLLDVGCGWGGMLMHAAARYGVRGVGATISAQQWELARKRVAEANLEGLVDLRLCDYREIPEGETFDAVCSIGMFEHVGSRNADLYFRHLHGRLRPGGRLLNHAISTPNGSVMGSRSFMARYVFPDGELQDVGEVVLGMERAGFEVRDVESLREHYALTLKSWVANLEGRWDEAVAMVGERRARVWRIYMIGAAISFEENRISVHQVLGVKTPPSGRSGMPLTRASWG